MHLGSRHEFSTFRRTLGSILAATDDYAAIDETAVTDWMMRHLTVRTAPHNDPDALGRLEPRYSARSTHPSICRACRRPRSGSGCGSCAAGTDEPDDVPGAVHRGGTRLRPAQSSFVTLTRQPQLASWHAASHPAQLAMTDFLDHAEQDLQDQLQAPSPRALELHVGLPPTTRLLDHHDLDNYPYPLAHRRRPGRIVSACARKWHADQLIAVSSRPVPTGTPMSVVIGFRCGPGRNWLNLWKPTIDALGPLGPLGQRQRPRG